jgi:Domain of unknown function (DUF5668)
MSKERQMDNRIPLGKLALGIVLLLVGILAFTDIMDMVELREIWRYWPVFLIFIGVSSEIDAFRERKSGGGGAIVAGIGVWFLFGNLHIFGLTRGTAMPLGIAVVGLSLILHALIDAPPQSKTTANKENDNDR